MSEFLVKCDEIGYISKHDDQSYGMFCPVARVYDDEIANRIVACINACEGISTDRLEQTMDWAKAGVSTAESLRQERDKLVNINAELLEALKEMVALGKRQGWLHVAIEQSEAAITKATSKGE